MKWGGGGGGGERERVFQRKIVRLLWRKRTRADPWLEFWFLGEETEGLRRKRPLCFPKLLEL